MIPGVNRGRDRATQPGLEDVRSTGRMRRRRTLRHLAFEVMEPRVLLAVVSWAVDASGFWDVAANWVDNQGVHRVPGPGDDVVISRSSASPTVTVRSGTITVNSMTSQAPLTLSGGSLAVTTSFQANNTLTLSGGTLLNTNITASTSIRGTSSGGTLDGVTVNGNLDLSANSVTLTIKDGLVLNGTATLGGSNAFATLHFAGTQTLGGSGTVAFAGTGYAQASSSGGQTIFYNDGLTLDAGTALTIGAGITVHGQRGFVGYGNYVAAPVGAALLIQGTVAADVADTTGISVDAGSWTNAGALEALNGGTLTVQNAGSGAGTLSTGDASTLTLKGTLTNAAAVAISSAGTGVVNLQTSIANAGGTLNLSGNGVFNLSGTIAGGTVAMAGGAALRAQSGTLDGVVVDGALDVTANAAAIGPANNAMLTIKDGLTLNGTATLGGTNAYGTLDFAGTQALGGTGTLAFAGSGLAAFQNNAGQTVFFYDGLTLDAGTTLTIGLGTTFRGQRGFVGYGNYATAQAGTALVIQGTVAADVADSTGISVDAGSWTNAGALGALNGGTLTVQNAGSGAGPLSAGDASTLTLKGTLANAGAVAISSAGTGAVNLQTSIANAGGTLNLSGSGVFNLAGTIAGGTVAMAGGAALRVQSGTLDGVVVDGALDVTANTAAIGPANNAMLTIKDGLTLNGTATLGGTNAYGTLDFAGTQALGGSGTLALAGTGLTAFQNNAGQTVFFYDGLTLDAGTTLTIGFGFVGYGNYATAQAGTALVIQGTVAADVADGTGITVNAGSVTDVGTIRVATGSSLSVTTGPLTVNGQGILDVQPGGTLGISGGLVGGTQNADRFQPLGSVSLNGTGTSAVPQLLEVMSQDLGNVSAGFDRNFTYGTLSVAPGNYVKLIDNAHNSSGTGSEALYVNSLVVPAGATLNLGGLALYVRFAQVGGTVTGGTLSRLAGGGPLTFATPTPGSLQAVGELDDWTLYGRANQSLSVVVNTGTGGVPTPLPPDLNFAQLQLFDPGGNLLATASTGQSGGDASILGTTLPADGLYRIRVSAAPGNSTSTGNYVLTAYDATVHTMPAALNQTLNGQLHSLFGVDQWTFSALANQQITFDLIAAGSPSLKFGLSGPGGYSGFTGLSTSSGLLTLPASGTYTLTVSGSSAAYAFRLDQTAQTDLTPGTPYQGTFAGSAQSQLFRVVVPGSQQLQVVLQDGTAAARNEVYLKYGAPPTRSDYQYRFSDPAAANQQVVAPSAAPGTWYILVYGNSIPAPSTYTLTASTAPIDLLAANPPHAGNGADTTLSLSGAGFTPGTTVSLVAAGGTTYPLTNPTVDSVVVTRADGGTARLSNALTMDLGGAGVLKTNIIVPSVIALHGLATIYVEYSNTGDIAMPAPLLVVTATQYGVAGALLTLDQSRQVPAHQSNANIDGVGQSLQLLASGATPGILQPGETIRVPVYYAGWHGGRLAGPIDFSLGVLKADNTTPVDWNSLQDASQPTGIDPTAWGAIFTNLAVETGQTFGDYVKTLDADASYLGSLGENVTDIGQLFDFMIQQADGLGPITQLGAAVDAQVPTPSNLSLGFGRFFSPSNSSRYQMGPLGLGWSDSWQTSLSVHSDGTIIVTGPGGSQRRFEPDSRYKGVFLNQPGDYSTLAYLGGGIYTLTEQYGQVTAFNADGSLNYVQDTGGNRITAGYTGGLLTSLTASSGQSLTIAYNAAGRITSVTDSVGRKTTYSYDSKNTYLLSVTTFDGQKTSYNYSSGGTAATNNALLSIAHPDGTHDYFTYDAQGRFDSTSSDGGAEKITFAYGPGGAVASTDADGNTTTDYFDNRGLIAKVMDSLGRATQYTYDSNFKMTQIINPAGQITTNTSDANGNLIRTTDPLGHTTSFTYTSTDDNLASVADANGNTTQYAYNGQGNLSSTTYADGTIASLAYDPVGNVLSSTDQMGQVIKYTYNSAGQVLTKTYAGGSVDTFTYDAHGNLTSTTDSTGTTTLTYDANDRLVQITYPTGLYLKYTYDDADRRTQMVDHSGFTVNYEYDAVGRLAELNDGSGHLIVKYTYDPAGHLVRGDMGNGTYTAYTYDASGDLLDLVNHAPDSTVNSKFGYTYNGLSLRTTQATLDGTWTYSYDADGELTHAVFASTNPALANQDLAYIYDAVGNRTSTVINGVTATYTTNDMNEYTSAGGTTYTYGADGNLISEKDAAGTTTYTYDENNHLVGVNTPDGNSSTFVSDALGYRVSATLNGMQVNSLIDPAGLGNVVGQYHTASTLIAHYTYGLGLISQTGSSNVASYFDFDAIGSTVGITSASGRYVSDFSYRPFGDRLIQNAQVSSGFTFAGKIGAMSDGSGFIHMRARDYSTTTGRFVSPDPIGILGGINLLSYSFNQPTDAVDPTGLSSSQQTTLDFGSAKDNARYDLYRNEPWRFKDDSSDRHVAGPGEIVLTVGGVIVILAAPEILAAASSSVTGAGGTGAVVIGAINSPVGQTVYGYLDQSGSVPDNPAQLIGGFGQIVKDPKDVIQEVLDDAKYEELKIKADEELSKLILEGSGKMNSTTTSTRTSIDPNSKTGPAGFGSHGFVAPSSPFPYRIDFENAPIATAPAQLVTVTDQLDPSLDWGTFELTGVGFGDTNISIPAGSQSYQATVPMTYNGETFDVEITLAFNAATGQVSATFQSINPKTQLPPDVLTGFLPPEDGTGRGMGYFTYIVQPKVGLATGTQIRNVALITFDDNPVIATDQVNDEDPTQGTDPAKMALNTIDAGSPTSGVGPLPPTETTTSFTVSWSGIDDAGGSGVATYDVYISDNGGPFTPYQTNTPATSAIFIGQDGHTYAFYSVATDNVGNVQPTPLAAQASTTVQLPPNQQATNLSAVAGSGTYGGTATLTATLTTGGAPLAGKTITFTLAVGANATTVGTATTGANGVATLDGVSPAGFNAGTAAGAVGAVFAGDATDVGSTASGSLTVSPAAATLSLGNLVFTYDGTPHAASVSTSPTGLAGVSVTYTQGGVAVAAPTQAGSYTVTATLDNPNYAATSVTGTLVINPATPVVNWTNPTAITYGTPLGAAQLDPTATVPGSFAYTPAAGTLLNAGQGQTLSVTFTPTDTTDYTSVTKMATINVLTATPTITWAAPASITYGTALGPDRLDASASFGGLPLAGTFSYSPAAGTVLDAASGQALSVLFAPSDIADFNPATMTVPIDVAPATSAFDSLSAPTITYGSASTTLSGHLAAGTLIPPGSVAITLNGVTESAPIDPAKGTFSASFPTGALIASTSPYTITYDYAAIADFAAAGATASLTVNKATPTITWTKPDDITSDTPLGAAQLDAAATVPGTLTYTPAAGTVLPRGPGHVLSVTFTPTDTTDYTTATGSTSINVLTPAPPPPPTPTPPHATGIAGVSRSNKGLISISVAFDEALAPGSASNLNLYTVDVGVKKRGKTIYSKNVGIRNISYDGNAHTVTINLAKPHKGVLQVTVHGGIVAANGASSSGDVSMIVK